MTAQRDEEVDEAHAVALARSERLIGVARRLEGVLQPDAVEDEVDDVLRAPALAAGGIEEHLSLGQQLVVEHVGQCDPGHQGLPAGAWRAALGWPPTGSSGS